MMSFYILEASWRKPVQELVLFLRMFWGGSCAIWGLAVVWSLYSYEIRRPITFTMRLEDRFSLIFFFQNLLYIYIYIYI